MKTKTVFATATAMGLLMATGAAYAASPNTLYITQSGVGNQTTVDQDAGPGGNDVGTSGAPALQYGDYNRFSETQSVGGGFANGDNDIVALRQQGNNNVFGSNYSNNAGWNRITNAVQQGNLNWVSVGRNASLYGTVSTLNIVGSSNSAAIGQSSGTGNTVTLLQIIGSNNEVAYGPGGPQGPTQWGVAISQSGNSNLVNEASISGSNNNGIGYGPINIVQAGNNNGQTLSVARITGSNGNSIYVNEQGNSNNFSIIQGLAISSTGNRATLNQLGSNNVATATQYGDANHLDIQQISDWNTVVANFYGDSNGNGSLSGVAATLLTPYYGRPLNADKLVEGTIYQDSTGSTTGDGNHVIYNVTGSNNLFAMAQIGGSNSITGTVGSNYNQVAVLQTGNSNTTSFTQTGGDSNSISVNQ